VRATRNASSAPGESLIPQTIAGMNASLATVSPRRHGVFPAFLWDRGCGLTPMASEHAVGEVAVTGFVDEAVGTTVAN
jgi:hypothetical protein